MKTLIHKKIKFVLPIFILFTLVLIPMSYSSSAILSFHPFIFLIQNIPLQWEGIAILVSIIIIIVASIVFALASIINSPTARVWSRMQIYEAALSIIMLIIFASFAYLFLLNPVHAFKTVGLLPGSCNTNKVTTIFTLSACDLSTFNNYAFESASSLYMASYILGFTPGFIATLRPIEGQPDINLVVSLNSALSGSFENVLTMSFNAILFMLVLNQIQLLLISSSLLFLFIFFVIGIIARTFGFSRSFGGLMIAFAIGIGLIYPILVSITYGFIDTNVQASAITIMENAIVGIIFSPLSLSLNTIIPLFEFIGYLAAGLTFIPFLNFLILDAFIVDFSSAIGERVSFMSLLAGIV